MQGTLKVAHVSGEKQLGGLFTKTLSRVTFNKLIKLIQSFAQQRYM